MPNYYLCYLRGRWYRNSGDGGLTPREAAERI
jgi:hypothetical protein